MTIIDNIPCISAKLALKKFASCTYCLCSALDPDGLLSKLDIVSRVSCTESIFMWHLTYLHLIDIIYCQWILTLLSLLSESCHISLYNIMVPIQRHHRGIRDIAAVADMTSRFRWNLVGMTSSSSWHLGPLSGNKENQKMAVTFVLCDHMTQIPSLHYINSTHLQRGSCHVVIVTVLCVCVSIHSQAAEGVRGHPLSPLFSFAGSIFCCHLQHPPTYTHVHTVHIFPWCNIFPIFILFSLGLHSH